MLNTLKPYQGCFYPIVTILALLVLLAFLYAVVSFDDAVLPKPTLTPVENYPDGIAFSEAILITQTGMKWLMLTYFYWLVGLTTVGFCGYQLRRALKDFPKNERRIIYAVFLAAILLTLAFLAYKALVHNTPLMSFQILLKNFHLLGGGFLNLASYNMALAYTAIVAMLVSTSLLLVPGGRNTTEQIRAITQVMYCGAFFLLAWIAQATEMYRFAASLLTAKEREQALQFVPTISLVAGIFASLLLAAAYISAYLWLQSYFREYRREQTVPGKPVPGKSPKSFMLSHWPKVIAMLMPILPGVVDQILHGFG